MFPLSPDHFATESHPAAGDNLRRPFFGWLDLIEAVRGESIATALINNLASLFGYDPGDKPWQLSPDDNFRILLHCLNHIGASNVNRESTQCHGSTRSGE